MPKQSYAFRVEGIAPVHDPAWHAAGESVHREFWRAVVGFVLFEKDRELAAGYDRFGYRMARIAASTRAKGRHRSHTGKGSPDAPPLDPAYALSRTRSLLDGRAKVDHAEFFWRFDEVSGRPWGQVLGFHRAGNPGRNLPVRDVIGISPVALRRVRVKANEWWLNYQAGRAHGRLAGELTIVIPPRSGRVTPERPKVNRLVAGAHIDVDQFTFGIGGGAEEFRREIAAGTTTGFRQRTPGVATPPAAVIPPPAPPPPSARPKPPVWVHPPRVVPGRPRNQTVPAAVQVTPAPVPKPGEKIPPKPKPRVKPAVRPIAVPTPAAVQPTVPTVAPKLTPAPSIDLADFARTVKAAFADVGDEGRFYDKVFISHAHAVYNRKHGPISLEEFKRRLIKALQSGHVALSRADLVEAMDLGTLRASLTFHPAGAEFHFIRTE